MQPFRKLFEKCAREMCIHFLPQLSSVSYFFFLFLRVLFSPFSASKEVTENKVPKLSLKANSPEIIILLLTFYKGLPPLCPAQRLLSHLKPQFEALSEASSNPGKCTWRERGNRRIFYQIMLLCEAKNFFQLFRVYNTKHEWILAPAAAAKASLKFLWNGTLHNLMLWTFDIIWKQDRSNQLLLIWKYY